MGADAGTKTGKNAKIDQNIFLKKIYLLSPLFIKCSLRRSPLLYEILVTNSGTKCYRRKKVFHLLFAFTEPFLPSGRGSVLRLQRLRFYSTEALFYIGAKASFFAREESPPPKTEHSTKKKSVSPRKTVHFRPKRFISVQIGPFRFIFVHFGSFSPISVRFGPNASGGY
ncbi:hypothetical protein IX321_002390 [Bacteroides pyogenes]|nr:hypothetical protein [Bacteroides pyogenes]MBR8709560.1 hypothetical protein [Bacteroides pyogenes]MBR8718439.1 hypothetical protein [Bacteroides pyogenes]MBR8747913.1 hypothetical protein [Bacteroides pyogenes]MBR8758219.1 hypothetical protein [Bacteroides pyogenes]